MASAILSEGILIVASVIIAGLITGIVIAKVGSFEGYYTATTEAQKDKMLTKFEIIHANQNSTDASYANVWIKNTGLTPIKDLDNVDLYFGQVDSADRIAYSTGSSPEWIYISPTTANSVWNQGETIQIVIQDDSALQNNQSYLVQFVTSNGVIDDFVFSVS